MRNRTDKRLYTIKDAEKYLSISHWTIREMVFRGDLPYLKNGRKYLFDVQDLDRWILQNKAQFTY